MEFEKKVISNEAWYYLMKGEEPLDPAATEEAEALRALHKGGGLMTEEVRADGTVSIFIIPPEAVESTLLGSFDPNMARTLVDGRTLYVEWLECDTEARWCVTPDWQVHRVAVVNDTITLPTGESFDLLSDDWGTVEPRQ